MLQKYLSHITFNSRIFILLLFNSLLKATTVHVAYGNKKVCQHSFFLFLNLSYHKKKKEEWIDETYPVVNNYSILSNTALRQMFVSVLYELCNCRVTDSLIIDHRIYYYVSLLLTSIIEQLSIPDSWCRLEDIVSVVRAVERSCCVARNGPRDRVTVRKRVSNDEIPFSRPSFASS